MTPRLCAAVLAALPLAACHDAPPAAEPPLAAPAPEAPVTAPAAFPGFSWLASGRLAGMPHPGRARPLAADLAFLRGEGVDVLVSLTEAPLDPAAVTAAGLRPLHFPVVDFTAPTVEQLGAFVAEARAAASRGQSVGLHCAGGLGRTGTFAAAWFVADGLTPDEAITRVRAARPGSIETPEQEAMVHTFARHLTAAR